MRHTRPTALRLCCAALSLALLLTLCPAALANIDDMGQYDPGPVYAAPDLSYSIEIPKGWIPLDMYNVKETIAYHKPKANLAKFIREVAEDLGDTNTVYLFEKNLSRREFVSKIEILSEPQDADWQTSDLMKHESDFENRIADRYVAWTKTSSFYLSRRYGRDMVSIEGTYKPDEDGLLAMRRIYLMSGRVLYSFTLTCDPSAMDDLALVLNEVVFSFDPDE